MKALFGRILLQGTKNGLDRQVRGWGNRLDKIQSVLVIAKRLMWLEADSGTQDQWWLKVFAPYTTYFELISIKV